MLRTRPALPPELRQKIVDLARAGRNAASLAREFEPTESTVRNWIAQADRDAGVRSDGLTTDERKELNQLRRENRTLREEREIRKKLQRGSRRRPARHHGSLRVHEGPGRSASHRHDDSSAGGLQERILRVGGSETLPAGERGHRTESPYPYHPCQSRGTHGAPRYFTY
jgi:transposase